MTRWRNWSGSVACRPAAVQRPRSLEELIAIVRRAAAAGQVVRAAGSGHSFTPLVATDGIIVSLERAGGLVEARRGQEGGESGGEAVVLGGTRLRDLGPALAARGLAMENLGDIDAQALAGAIATGTHGTGAAFGSLSTQVAGIELVTASGDLVSCSGTSEPDVFKAAQVSLGALAVLWKIRLRCVPAFRLRYVRRNMDLEECLGRLPELRKHRHFELYWFPHTDRVATKALDRTEEPTSGEGLSRVLSDVVLENGIFWLLSEACRLAPALTRPVSRLSARFVSEGVRVAASHRVFATPRLVRFDEMEYAVSAERGPDCLREIRRFVADERIEVHFPVEFRVVTGDDVWLSPAFGRDSAYIAVHMYRGMARERYFRGVEAIFRNHGGRPHWGKMHTLTSAELAPLYPEWERFQDVRRRLDPGGLFLSPYLRRLLEA